MRRVCIIGLMGVLLFPVFLQAKENRDAYQVDEATWNEAMDIYRAPKPENLVFPTQNPEAQWFPKAGLGLFMHWGIHSVDGIDPSWSLIKGCPWHNPDTEYEKYWSDRSRYYQLASQFNPSNYDPDPWMAAAQKAGFQYAVLTTKHHDGYALWPSQFGNLSTRQYMNGRDLLRPYVAACRKYGIKVGFYFSPRDWHYPGYTVNFTYGEQYDLSGISPEENEKNFQRFFAYTIGQLKELLTRYGKIDVLWFDGMGWDGISDTKEGQTLNWVRTLQPGIVINPRWSGNGDFKTTECQTGQPEGYRYGEWWEACDIWMQGSWGYAKSEQFKSLTWFFERLTQTREWGGNFLCNVGPRPDGRMPENFYKNCDILSSWMKQYGASIFETDAVEESLERNVPCTRKGSRLYAHLLPSFTQTVKITSLPQPKRVYSMQTGQDIPFQYENRELQFDSRNVERSQLDDVVVIEL